MKLPKASRHLSKADAEALFQLYEFLSVNEVAMTKDQYRFVKKIEWYPQTKFWISHLSKAGFNEFQAMPSAGSRGKYPAYLEVWSKFNSPLMKALL